MKGIINKTLLVTSIALSAQSCSKLSAQQHIDSVLNVIPLANSPKIVKVIKFEHKSNQADVDSFGKFVIEEKAYDELVKEYCVNTNRNFRKVNYTGGSVCQLSMTNAYGTVDIYVENEKQIISFRYSG